MVTSSDAIDMNLGLGTDPMSVTNGGALSVTGTGYAPGSEARVILRSNPVTLAVVQADENGRVQATVRIPNDASRGKHLVDLDGWDEQGQPMLLRRVIDVSLGPPWWIVAVAITSATLLMLAAVLYRRRRGASRAIADSARSAGRG